MARPRPQRSSRNPARALVDGLAIAAVALAATQVADAQDMPRLVSVTGQGESRALPDMAYVTLGVEARKPSLADARSEVNAAVERVLALTRELKIEPKYVDSTGLQVQPEYRWNEQDRERVLLGYVVSRQIEVELHDLERLGTLLERSVSAGANQVGGARLDSSRRAEFEREALRKAVADARLDAETLATAAGVKLGAVFSLNAAAEPMPMPMFAARAMPSPAPMAADAAAESYATAELTFRASVSAQWRLE
jgi:uncharacterized protein YggE